MNLTDHFKLEEFASKDGSVTPSEVVNNLLSLAHNLEILRGFVNTPIKINSGYRSVDHNKAVGGAKNSQHLIGKAADIVVRGFTPKEIKIILEGLIRIGAILEGGIGVYETFTHYDIRGEKARWNG